MTRIILLAIILSIFASCVPMRQFQELQQKNETCKTDRDSLKALNEDFTVKTTEMTSEIEILNNEKSELKLTIAQLEDSLNYYKQKHTQLLKEYNDLFNQQQKLLEGNNREIQLLMTDLQKTKENLQFREDELNRLQTKLNEKEISLNILQIELNNRTEQLNILEEELDIQKLELEAQNKKLLELQKILFTKDSIVLALKNKVSDALLGFQDKGLSVHQKNGKVYVSLEEKLLFKFGSSDVDPNGEKAIKELAKVLEQNNDINILIEGHTDDVGNQAYNWDLSTKRATSIVKIIIKSSSIDPKRLTAAGRGQFMPIDPAKTDKARKKNRRTEIILTPQLDELFKILENN